MQITGRKYKFTKRWHDLYGAPKLEMFRERRGSSPRKRFILVTLEIETSNGYVCRIVLLMHDLIAVYSLSALVLSVSAAI